MLAVMNMASINEKFQSIDSAKLTLPAGSEVGYLVEHQESDLPAIANPADGSITIEEVPGRGIIAGTSFTELAGGLLNTMQYFAGLYTAMILVEVVLKGQIGGVYATYKFKAV
ncbi:hypothetical protein pEaSNUABM54_00280 [Erwinia phage pEa_SNUABM_54]|nr:hypothetical protein pEaSNUABM54_00280 [Erwinia phage pEa_SNUABM_54]